MTSWTDGDAKLVTPFDNGNCGGQTGGGRRVATSAGAAHTLPALWLFLLDLMCVAVRPGGNARRCDRTRRFSWAYLSACGGRQLGHAGAADRDAHYARPAARSGVGHRKTLTFQLTDGPYPMLRGRSRQRKSLRNNLLGWDVGSQRELSTKRNWHSVHNSPITNNSVSLQATIASLVAGGSK